MEKEIRRKIYEYTKLTGKDPGRLLVGLKTAQQIQAEYRNQYVLRETNRGIRDEIMGLPIYVMDDDDYLEVAP